MISWIIGTAQRSLNWAEENKEISFIGLLNPLDHLILTWAEEKDQFYQVVWPPGPLILSHAYQQRTHLLEESRSFYLQHQKRQVSTKKTRMFENTLIIWIGKEWFSKLPPDARILKENLSQKNKYKVNCRISWLRLLSVHSWPEILQVWHNLHKKRIDPSARGLSDSQVKYKSGQFDKIIKIWTLIQLYIWTWIKLQIWIIW